MDLIHPFRPRAAARTHEPPSYAANQRSNVNDSAIRAHFSRSITVVHGVNRQSGETQSPEVPYKFPMLDRNRLSCRRAEIFRGNCGVHVIPRPIVISVQLVPR